tara:strand:+ start:272 stop:1066 length:795 start_codon:yes stop_codon:yes gene_type:complete
MNYKQLNKNLKYKGYFLIKNFINKKKIRKLKIAISDLFLNELEYIHGKTFKFKNKNNLWNDPKFCNLIINFRKNYPVYFSKVYNILKNNPLLLDILNDKKIISISKNILNIKDHNLWNGEFMVRIDVPNDKRNVIGWHQEANYYKNQTKDGKNGIVYWIALSEIIKKIHGAIMVKEKSHEAGLIKARKFHEKKSKLKNKFKSVTFRPDIKKIKKFKAKSIETKIGDLIGMDMRLFHQSGQNNSKIIRLSCINRVFDTSSKSWPN